MEQLAALHTTITVKAKISQNNCCYMQTKSNSFFLYNIHIFLFYWIFSLFASTQPDGLEWSIERITGSTEIETVNSHVHMVLENIQKATAVLKDYSFKEKDSVFGASLSGITGSMAVLGICLVVCFTFRYLRRKKKTI